MYRFIFIHLCFLAMANATIASDPLLHHTSAYDQKQVSLTANAFSCIAVWNSYGQDSSSGGIFGTVLDLSQPDTGQDFQVNLITEGNQSAPDVAVLTNGLFAVCWQGPWQELDAENILIRFFDSNATPVTGDILVNQYTDGSQRLPKISALYSGQYVVAWETHSYPDRSKKAVCCRIFDANGNPATDEILGTDQSYAARNVDIAANGPDQFVLTWLNDRTTDSIWARPFDTQGQALADSFQVSEFPFKTLTSPNISSSQSGQFAIVWDGDPNAGSNDDIHIRFYDVNHAPLSPDFRLNASIQGAQRNPSVSMNDELCAVVAWETDHLREDQGLEVMTRYIDANGLKCGSEKSLSNSHIGDQEKPAVVLTPHAQFILAWESSPPETTNTDIHYCWGHCPSESDMNADSVTDFIDFSMLANLRNEDSPENANLNSGSYFDLDLLCSEWLTRSIWPAAD